MATTAQSLPRTMLLLAGLSGALALRLAFAGGAANDSAPAGLIFSAALLLVATAAGWRPGRLRIAPFVTGVGGAAGLLAIPLWMRLSAGPVPTPAFPMDAFLLWAAVVSAVAVAEEAFLRGILFSAIERAHGAIPAVAVSAAAFALLHVPLYGWAVMPLDLAAGIWLGGLRVVSGGVTAPATAHALADLALWCLA
jgi:membrane protease YdiL (CAAX protease family)